MWFELRSASDGFQLISNRDRYIKQYIQKIRDNKKYKINTKETKHKFNKELDITTYYVELNSIKDLGDMCEIIGQDTVKINYGCECIDIIDPHDYCTCCGSDILYHKDNDRW